jgi:DNA topoisomerase IA
MRTDSKVYSVDFINLASEYITATYNAQYFNSQLLASTDNTNANNKPKKGKKIKDSLRQEAHEAIRPTNISLRELPEEMDMRRYTTRLYYSADLSCCCFPLFRINNCLV